MFGLFAGSKIRFSFQEAAEAGPRSCVNEILYRRLSSKKTQLLGDHSPGTELKLQVWVPGHWASR